jgi:hypothetical protein
MIITVYKLQAKNYMYNIISILEKCVEKRLKENVHDGSLQKSRI